MLSILLTVTLIAGLLGVLLWYGFTHLATFLNLSHPITAEILVIEGWLPDQALVEASKLFWQEGYQRILTTGPPLHQGHFLSDYKTYAELSAATLIVLGIPKERIIALPCPAAERFRTYTSALAVKQYCEQYSLSPEGMNLFTLGCHARRSRFIFHQVFAPMGLAVGVVATPPDSFDLHNWWSTSAGVRTVIGEFIAYAYVRLISWKT